MARWFASRNAGGSPAGVLVDAVRQADRAPDPRSPSSAADSDSVPRLIELLRLLDELRMDDETLAAAILHDLNHSVIAASPERATPGIRVLLEGQQAAERIWKLHATTSGSNAEGLRRLLLAIVRDLRVVFILLARHLIAMRRATTANGEKQRRLARLAVDIHAPLANRLGIRQLKWELEDLAFRYLQPETYRRIAKLLDSRRGDRDTWIVTTQSALVSAMTSAGIQAEISGRPKHIYSIWRKLQRKNDDFSQLHDLRALRVLVRDVPTCYAALSVVHALWQYLPGEFDDYIAHPKGNHYQSLHTAVTGPDGLTLEVQIRTPDMHEHAELGVAAHWRYKEGGSADAQFERKISSMRQLLEGKDDADDDAALLAGYRTDVLDDRVYLLTPDGDVRDLPHGATVLDFAYRIHTNLGHRCRGAKVNDRIVPLTWQPTTGDRIEVLTGNVLAPRRDWLSTHHGFLTTTRAREKVRSWFKHIDRTQNIASGRGTLERELRRLGIAQGELERLPAKLDLPSLDDVCVAVAVGELTAGHLARLLLDVEAPLPTPRAPTAAKTSGASAIVVDGIGNLLTSLARCCQPLPGDQVCGFITRGRGISVHRLDCSQLAKQRALDAKRVIDVHWSGKRVQHYDVEIQVIGYDRKWLLKDVTNVIAAANVHVIAVNHRSDPSHATAEMRYNVRVSDFQQLDALLAKLLGVPNIIDARRLV
ncbi:MAG: bifunctional (p)ppGpp synthetase/guanosine-3',5'-bis(diphosphate) 3'-pyrophosphohydrolase [Dokdonella sp.]